jgi:Cytochrome b5-like Heme/Steroid binding domain
MSKLSKKNIIILTISLTLMIILGMLYFWYQGQGAPIPEVDKKVPTSGKITKSQLQANKNRTSCWSAIKGQVYNLTDYVSKHPGGAELFNGCGKEIDNMFPKHPGGRFDTEENLQKIAPYRIGELVL